MANKDSTAVNKLIERSQQKTLDGDLDDLFGDESERQARKLVERARVAAAAEGTPRPEKVTAPPPRRTAQVVVPPMPSSSPSTSLHPSAVPPPLPRGRVPASTQPPTQPPPVAAAVPALPPLPKANGGGHALPRPSGPHAAAPPPRPARSTAPPPMTTPAPAGREPDSVTAPVDMGEFNAPWFQPSTPFARTDQSQEISFDDESERRHSTRVVARPRGRIGWVLFSAFVLGVGVAAVHMTVGIPGIPPIGGAAPAASAAAQPVIAAQPVAAPAAEPSAPAEAATVTPTEAPAAVAPAEPAAAQAAVTALVMVTLTSQPAGATAMLVDGHNTVSLGKTPLTTSLDPGRRHEVLFSLDGYATSLAVIDPSVATNVVVPLAAAVAGAAADAPVVAPLPEPAPVVEPAPAEPAVVAAPEPKAKEKKAKPEPKAPKAKQVAKAEPAPKAKAKDDDKPEPAAKGGAGILALGAKPPCEIFIDGKSTGLTTPQREIKLPAGKHSVTLVNKGFGIKKTFSVSVAAGAPTKVLKDFSDEIK